MPAKAEEPPRRFDARFVKWYSNRYGMRPKIGDNFDEAMNKAFIGGWSACMRVIEKAHIEK